MMLLTASVIIIKSCKSMSLLEIDAKIRQGPVMYTIKLIIDWTLTFLYFPIKNPTKMIKNAGMTVFKI